MIFPSFLLPLPFLFFLFGQASGCTFHRAEGAFRTALAARKKTRLGRPPYADIVMPGASSIGKEVPPLHLALPLYTIFL